ncbi:MAG: DUF3160 domain-containing protein [Patescibacteria group bacterium]|jgi:hypothetical protein
MFDRPDQNQETATDSSSVGHAYQQTERRRLIKIILLLSGVVVLVILGFIIARNLITTKLEAPSEETEVPAVIIEEDQELITPSLPELEELTAETQALDLSQVSVEYLSFADFYQPATLPKLTGQLDYDLPLNVKMEAINYYAVSRKLDLDPVVEELNEAGWAKLDNPWAATTNSFSEVYQELANNNIPILLTADFITDYYQGQIKKLYKDIEASIFYNNLWIINKELYLKAKNRYENRLAAVGNINDPILEAARMQASYFAIALNLLKPQEGQVSTETASIQNQDRFSQLEANRFYFLTPPYLSEGVKKEEALIRAAKEKTKSPNLLYLKDYQEFIVPAEYQASARLTNLYLTMRWLNSVFPLEYQSEACPDCLLDKEDWRLSMLAANFTAADFSASGELKTRWARIYKIMSFFNPTREDLNYVLYRDNFKELFGSEATVEKTLGSSEEADHNLLALQAQLNKLEFPEFLGGINQDHPSLRSQRGFKVLSLAFSPNEYIFSQLSYPLVGASQLAEVDRSSQTACLIEKTNYRCAGAALDVVNLISPSSQALAGTEISYANYQSQVQALRAALTSQLTWQTNNYWSTLKYLANYLEPSQAVLTAFKTPTWLARGQQLAVSAWLNNQLPLGKITAYAPSQDSLNLGEFDKYAEYSYIEPNLALITDLIANSLMIEKMLTALQIDREDPGLLMSSQNLTKDLQFIEGIMTKELSGQKLSDQDNEDIMALAKKLKITSGSGKKEITINFPLTKKTLRVSLGNLQLLALVHEEESGPVISVGPVWQYQERY